MAAEVTTRDETVKRCIQNGWLIPGESIIVLDPVMLYDLEKVLEAAK